MRFKAATVALVISTVFKAVTAHTQMTNFYVNGKNQGDGNCVRMNMDIQRSTYPIEPITSRDMACGMFPIP
jgi:hypothetical protein